MQDEDAWRANRFLIESANGMSMAFILSRAVHAAASLSIADLLSSGPRSAAQLAASSGTHALSLQRLMKALVSFGVFTERDDGAFELNAFSRWLRADVPHSMRNFALYMGSDWQAHAWARLIDCVRSGKPVYEGSGNGSVFEYFADHPDEGRLFDRSMQSLTAACAAGIAATCDLSAAERVVDIGGGSGALLTALLKVHRRLHGVLFEMPGCIAAARRHFDASGLSDRCSCHEGNVFRDVPPVADVYVLKNVLHDWDDERSIEILRNCQKAMSNGSKLLIVEVVIAGERLQAHEAVMDLSMMLLTGGCERTESAYRELIERSGLRLRRAVRTPTAYSVLETSLG